MKTSTELYNFLKCRDFDSAQLNRINRNKVTPLSVAIEEGNKHVVQELLELGANPIIINGHGNTCLFLAQGQKDIRAIIEAATERYTCNNITCIADTKFSYNSITYRVVASIGGGSGSIGILVVQNEASDELFILKVKQIVTSMEIRNNIILEQFVDAFNIKYFNNDGKCAMNVQGLIKKFVPGISLYDVISNVDIDIQHKDKIITASIVALCILHKNSIIHGDALATNCIWNEKTTLIEFIDFETMLIRSEMSDAEFEEQRFADLQRLILGDISQDGAQTFGLKNYTKNIISIIDNLSNDLLEPKFKRMLRDVILQDCELKLSKSENRLSI